MVRAYKLVRARCDGTFGPLFIDRKTTYRLHEWVKAKAVPTKGFAFRPGFHCCSEPVAPHLSKKDRVWLEVSIKNVKKHQRPESQGGLWYTAQQMRVERVLWYLT